MKSNNFSDIWQKKVVATLKTGTGKQFTKCIKMVKSDKTGAYIFKRASSPTTR